MPCGDALALALALDYMLSDDLAKQAYGAHARARVESSFSLEAVGRQLRSFLFQHSPDADWETELQLHHSAESQP